MVQAGKDHLFRRWQSWDPTDFNSFRQHSALCAKSYCGIAVGYRCAGLWNLLFRGGCARLGTAVPLGQEPLAMDCLICLPPYDIYSV